ncbi:hypothetical protein JOC77_002136 [Peribacillus deserti]|uniref:Uncharacterized protein n=1 Tax=Peribacillus deserti TaxID=673318 RepID=A0ABS2QHR4_9BACI|nr:hypothetical protein [Peribacillus deserti]MBM7692705.1 hypothetical protein [Peribacillus deserti]
MKNHVFCHYNNYINLDQVSALKNQTFTVHCLYPQSAEKPEITAHDEYKECKVHSLSNDLESAEKEINEILTQQVGDEDKIYVRLSERPNLYELVIMQIVLESYSKAAYFIKGRELVPAFSEAEDKIQDLYARLHDLICKRNYHSAGKLVYHSFQSPELTKMLIFGERLKSLDLAVSEGQEDYFDLLMETLREMDEDEALVEYADSMKNLRNRDQKSFISYLHNSAARLYDENKLIDFVVLYYRLTEELLLYALGWDIDWNKPGSGKDTFIYRKEAYFKLDIPKERVTRHFHSYLRTLNREVRVLEKKQEITQVDQYFIKLHRLFNDEELQEVLKLRHAGVSGHGFCDFSKEQFENICEMNPLEKLEPIFSFLNITFEDGLFELIEKSSLYLARKGLESSQQASQGA